MLEKAIKENIQNSISYGRFDLSLSISDVYEGKKFIGTFVNILAIRQFSDGAVIQTEIKQKVDIGFKTSYIDKLAFALKANEKEIDALRTQKHSNIYGQNDTINNHKTFL